MLFTDAPLVSVNDLLAVDNEVQDVANACDPAIDLSQVCLEATGDMGDILLANIQSIANYLGPAGFSTRHIATVSNTGLSQTHPRFKLCQLVTHNPDYPAMRSHIQRWGIRYALFYFYREASNRRSPAVDRYASKMERFQNDARDDWDLLMRQGLPVVAFPLPAPGSFGWPGCGVFDASSLGQATQAGTNGGNFEVAIAWTASSYNVSAANRNDGESGPSPRVSFTVDAGNALTVSIAGLTPPDGSPAPSGVASGVIPSVPATGWQVLVGQPTTPGQQASQLWVQNSNPLPLTQTTFTLPGDPVTAVPALRASLGQNPITNCIVMRTVTRW